MVYDGIIFLPNSFFCQLTQHGMITICKSRYARHRSYRVGGPKLPAKGSSTYQERNQEIGALLQRARLRAKKSIRATAAHLGTTKERYAAIESGRSFISAVELEDLLRWLRIPYHEVWPPYITGDPPDVVVDALPGQAVTIRVHVAAEAVDPYNDDAAD